MMYWFETVFIVSLTLQMSSAEGGLEICRAEWSQLEKNHSIGGQLIPVSTLNQCQDYCVNNQACLAVDFNAYGTEPCWAYTDPSLLKDFYDDNDFVTQYRLTRNCSTQEVKVSNCPNNWIFIKEKSTDMKSDESFNSTLSTCFTYCRFSPKCQGVIFDNTTWLSCRVFNGDALKDSLNLKDSSTSTVYLFDKDCSGNVQTYGQCSGQSFPPSSSWCLPTEKISVKSVFFKFHPFCCQTSSNTLFSPIDSSSLKSVNAEFFDSNYFKTVLDCLNVTSCALIATSYKSLFVTSDVCAVQDTTNFVSIAYSCTGSSLNKTSTTEAIVPSMLPTTIGILLTSSTLLPTTTVQQQEQTTVGPLLPLPTLPQRTTVVLGTPSPTSYVFTTSKELESQTTLFSETMPAVITTQTKLSLSTKTPLSPLQSTSEKNTAVFPPATAYELSSQPQLSLKSSIPFSRTDSPSTTSKGNQDGTFNEEKSRTPLILGAIGTAFGAVCLLFFILLLIVVVRIYLSHRHESVDIVDKVSTISWKKFLQGSSSA